MLSSAFPPKTAKRALAALAGVALASSPAQLVRQANTTLTLPPTLPTATGYTTVNALGSLTFNTPMATVFPEGETNRLFVVERNGTVRVVINLSTTPALGPIYLQLANLLGSGESLRTDGENGFLSMAFHPNFATNRTLYVYYTVRAAGSQDHQRLHRVTMNSATSNSPTIESHSPMLTIYDRASNHNGGELHFGADGYLYLSLGDEGNGDDSFNNARFINQASGRTGFWGKMLRLDVDSKPGSLSPNPHTQNSTAFPSAVTTGTYRIPPDNPFIGFTHWHSLPITASSVRTEIYATGLRNPFRWSFDKPTGRLFLGDVGQNIWEEVDLIVKGGDYGWSWREGDHTFNSPPSPTSPPGPAQPGDPPGTGFNPIPPIFDYDHTNSGNGDIYGNVITGGAVMRGNRLPELYGAYIYADNGSGQIVALREQANGTWTPQLIASDSGVVDFGEDPRNGDLLLCDLTSNAVERLERSGTSGTNPPALLSQTGAFSNLSNLTTQPGIVPYAPNVAFWSDYAIKSRWFAIKNTTDTISFSADGNWSFPTGMVWIKHFDFETERGNPATRRKLETRFLVKTQTEVYGLTYKWRADQTDADLVPEDGFSELIPASNPPQTWRYPSRTECRVCHTPVAGHALSFNTRQLNRTHVYGSETPNQIQALSDAGYLSAPVDDVHNFPAFAAADDTTQSLEWRVRSYLAVNCVQCHQPGGTAQGNWDARATTPTDLAGLINGVLVNTASDSANRFAVPGDPAHSMVLARIQGAGVPRMPPLATSEIDPNAVSLLTAWIAQELPGRLSFADWQTLHFGSTSAPDSAPTDDPDADGNDNSSEFLNRSLPLVPNAPFAPIGATVGNTFQLSFEHPANRSLLIETTTDFANWSRWDVPGNVLMYPATTTLRTLTGPRDTPERFFRARISQP